MRIFITLAAGIMMTGSVSAAVNVYDMRDGVPNDNPLDITNQMTARHVAAMTPSAPMKVKAKEAVAEPIITEAPAGKQINYSRNSLGYFLYYGIYTVFTMQEDQAGQIVDGDDGFTYIKNPIGGLTYNAYLKGVREGDRIRVDLPQIIYQENSTDEDGSPIVVDFYARIMEAEFDDEGTRYFVPTEDQTFYYTVDGNKIMLDLGYDITPDENDQYVYPDKVLSLTTVEGQWAYYSDCWQEWTLLDQDMMTMPEGLETEKWAFFHNGLADYAEVAFDGDYVYITNLTPVLPEVAIRGKVEGDNVIFESGLYIGNYVSYYVYQMMCYMNDGDPELRDSMTMTYDRENKIIACTDPNDIILLNTSLNRVYAVTNFQNPKFTSIKPVTQPTPMTPEFVEFLDYYETYGYGYFVFNVYNYNDIDEIFNPDNMWYTLIIDGVVETLYPEDYIMLPEEMTNIPFNFKDSYDIHIDGAKRTVCIFPQGIETVGTQLFHEYDGKVYESGILTYNLLNGEVESTPSSINGIFNEVGEAEWYDLQGRRVMNPANGIFVCKIHCSDGSTRVMKVARR